MTIIQFLGFLFFLFMIISGFWSLILFIIIIPFWIIINIYEKIFEKNKFFKKNNNNNVIIIWKK
ncbi:MAG: hypothetical protein NHF94_00210 [Candidatus Bostrichicola ureolyticus]|nr:MAG: hypothetical protein NHF94_00210 [Candidatus Bostrichicola ureolyticus]